MSTALATKAARLTAAASRQTFDPFTEIDWDVPMDDGSWHLPPAFLPLYGTPQWEAMSEGERRTYSRHETASLCAAGIWFENILMHLVLKHLYELSPQDPTHRYLLIETADECRHSAMFGEYIRRAGTPDYRVPIHLRLGGRFLKATATRAAAYLAILAAEELLDVTNRSTMKDPDVHPISAGMARIHVAEEARHVSFAKTWLAEEWPNLPRRSRFRAIVVAPFAVRGITDAVTNPAVYRTLDIKHGWRAAVTNRHHRARIVRDLGKLTTFLTELGAINRWTRPVWRGLGLVG